jgi:hypothetical protein
MSQQMQSAMQLARMGFRVFPLIPGDKKPAVSRFPVVATTDLDQIVAWWTDRPTCNVGVSTTGFVVVDIDTKKGQHALQNYYDLGGTFETFTVRTATGGYHCYFAGPDSKLAVDITPGVDIRSHGGFVVGPGSVTSASNEGCVNGEYTIVYNKPIVEVPLAVELLLQPPGTHRQRDDSVERDEPFNIENGKVWLQAAEPAVEGHGGNSATFRVCAKLVRDFALTPETAYQLLAAHWNHRCIPPWQPGELWTLVQHADAYGTGDLGAGSPAVAFGGVTIIDPPKIEAAPAYNPIGVHMGNAVPPAMQTARAWVVDKLLMNGDLTVLGGMGAAGKSVFQLVLAAHLSLGKDFGPFKLKVSGTPMRSIVYNAEDDAMEQSRRLLAVCQHFNFDYYVVAANIAFMDDRQGDLILCYQNRGVPMINQEAVDFVLKTGRDCDADVIFFDPLVNIHQLNENDNTHMRFLATTLKGIARVLNIAVMAAHHTAKSSGVKEKGDADVFRGGGALINTSRIAIILSSITKGDGERFGISEAKRADYARVDTGKTNYGKKDGVAIAWLQWSVVRHIGGDLIGVPHIADVQQRKSDQDNEVALIIRDAMRVQGSGAFLRTEAAKAITDSGHILGQLSPSGLRNIVARMFSDPVTVDGDTLLLVKVGEEQLIKLQ